MNREEAGLVAMILRRLGVDAVSAESPYDDMLDAVRVDIPGTAMSWWVEYVEDALHLIYDLLSLGVEGYLEKETKNAVRE